MFKLKIGDEVQITSGKDKNKKGKIERILPKEFKVVVPGVNLYKRHRKVTRRTKAGIYEISRPLLLANIALICPKCGKRTRVGFKLENKTKIRFCKKCKGVV